MLPTSFFSPSQAVFASSATAELQPAGADSAGLPEWNLGDLYDAPESPALKADLEKAGQAASAMQDRYAGKLEEILAGGEGGDALAEAVRAFEALNDVMGRIVSYASLLYSADTADPTRQKFYGDIQETITAISSNLLFFPLELNRLDDVSLERAMADSSLGHYRPWLEDLRKEKPYQLEDKLEQLFHEKAVTARGAWDRLFNETMTALRFDVEGQALSLEPTLNFLLDSDETKRKHAAEALAGVFNDDYLVPVGNFNNLVNGRHATVQMGTDYGFRAMCHGCSQLLRVHHRNSRKCVDQNWLRTHRQHVGEIGFVVVCRKNDLVAGTHIGSSQREFDG